MGEKDLLLFCVVLCYGWANTKKCQIFSVMSRLVCLSCICSYRIFTILNEEICEMLRIYK